MNRKMTDWKDFVFANPHFILGAVSEASPHLAHLVFAHALSQNKKTKRAKFTIANLITV